MIKQGKICKNVTYNCKLGKNGYELKKKMYNLFFFYEVGK